MDLLCSDCGDMHPEFMEFLNMDFLDGKVKDQVRVTYSFFPLAFHHKVWIVTKLVPYFIDGCLEDEKNCKFLDYVDFSLTN